MSRSVIVLVTFLKEGYLINKVDKGKIHLGVSVKEG